jgi:lipopolysaccharide export system permease protein
MKLLDRYIIRQMALYFLLIIAALTALYLLVDVFERLGSFQERQLPAALACRYFFLKLPVILDQIFPVTLLLSGIITLGLLINRRELQSLNAAGISKIRVMLPFGAGAVICTLLSLAAAQWLLPASGLEVERIWSQQVMGENGEGIVREGVTFFRGRQGIYTFEDRGQRHEVLNEFRYQELGRGGGSGRRILYARSATYSAGLWHLRDGQIRTEEPTVKVEPFVQKTLALPEEKAVFFAPAALDFEQPLATLVRRALDHQGHGHRQAVLDVNSRLSFLLLGLPLLCLALPVILCFELGRTGINLALAIPVSAGLAFLVWGVWSGLQAMAQVAAISAVTASWSIHLLCLAAGTIIMGRRR